MKKILSNGIMVLILAAFIVMFTTGVAKTYVEATKEPPRHGFLKAPKEVCPFENPAQTCPFLQDKAIHLSPRDEREIQEKLNRTA